MKILNIEEVLNEEEEDLLKEALSERAKGRRLQVRMIPMDVVDAIYEEGVLRILDPSKKIQT